MSKTINTLQEACKKAGVKCTSQRRLIFSELINRKDHPDAETLYKSVRKKNNSISLDTVYRTLWLLKDLGLIKVLGSARERTRFDGNLEKHHHFICNICGKTIDFNDEQFDQLECPHDFKNIGTASALQVHIHGTCLNCSRQLNKQED